MSHVNLHFPYPISICTQHNRTLILYNLIFYDLQARHWERHFSTGNKPHRLDDIDQSNYNDLRDYGERNKDDPGWKLRWRTQWQLAKRKLEIL
jgi:hypothetical protein